MKKKSKNGFTLIELIAVLVIMAVIAVIVTPLVMNIVKKAKDSANKRSVDAYGKSVELAVATYLLNYEEYPTSLEGLKVEYSGNEVVCNVKKLNEDGSIYLSECRVADKEVKDSKTDDGWYHYGKTTNTITKSNVYNIGDKVIYKGIEFYVITPSDENSDSVTLLKAEPLTVDEVNKYGVGHINKYTWKNQNTVANYKNNGYGGVVYYSSETCGYVDGSYITSSCITSYDASDVKYAVDAWVTDNFNMCDLTEDSLGYKARLLTLEELTTNLGYIYDKEATRPSYKISEDTPTWVYNSKYFYWTMSQCEDSTDTVWSVYDNGNVYYDEVYYDFDVVVRPVVTVLKSAI